MVQTASFQARETTSLVKRYVRTDFYLDPTLYAVSERSSVWVHNLSAVWLDDPDTIDGLVEDFKVIYDTLPPPELGSTAQGTVINYTMGCLAALLHGDHATPTNMREYARVFSELSSVPDQQRIEQRVAVDLLAQNIVIERSPPVAQALSSFLHGATSVSLGALVGMNMTDSPYLMMITIPAGVIVMGTALGVSRGLQQGLQKRVEKFVNPPKKRR
jgi:hypothetical protein